MSDVLRKGTLNIKWTEPLVKISGGAPCAVIIPVYKDVDKLTKFEEKSIERTVQVLGGKYEIILLCGKSLKCDTYSEKFGYDFSFCKCSDEFFMSQKSYSDLCEKYELYDVFSMYEYILICQTDAWVFEDRLEYFMGLGYDYIGAIHMLKSSGKGARVGNGGFSLRKPAKFSEVCKKTDFNQFKYTLYEDCAFSIRLKREFNIAPVEVAFEFGWQEQPRVAYELTGKLPMGCHNPMKNNWNFWREHIKLSEEVFDDGKARALVGDVKFAIRPKYDRNVLSKANDGVRRVRLNPPSSDSPFARHVMIKRPGRPY